jgi:7-carboxy-7-deazaguanine synthase
MFGRNEVAKVMRDPEGKLLVTEIFYTIQGEGPDAGRPAVFVRLAKCNLRCFFCDTQFESGVPMTYGMVYDQITVKAFERPCKLVVITGGEPFLQNWVPLVRELNLHGWEVSFETAGTVWSEWYLDAAANRLNKIICSPKTCGINRDLIPHVAAWKYIVAVGEVDETTGLPSKSTQVPGQAHPIYRPSSKNKAPIYIQPMDEQDAEKNKANGALAAQICMKHGYRLSLQMHKLVGVP